MEESRMKIIASGVLFEGNAEDAKILAFTNLCRLSNGEIMAAFQCGREKNHAGARVITIRSSDNGRTWHDPVDPFTKWAAENGYTVHVVYLSEITPGKLFASIMLCDHKGDPDLPFFNPKTGGALPIYVGVAESYDNGHVWSCPRLLPTGRFNDLPSPVMSPIVEGANGRLFLPFETSKTYYDTEKWHHYAACLESQDGGNTWPEVKIIATDPEDRYMYWDHRMVSLGGNRIVDFFWTYDSSLSKDTDVHMSLSQDGGISWPRTPSPTGITGQVTSPIFIGNNCILAVTVDRFKDKVIKCHMSHDLGMKWKDELVIYRHSVPDTISSTLNANLAEMQYWSFGHPCGIKINSGEVLIAWYCGSPEKTQIRWAAVEL